MDIPQIGGSPTSVGQATATDVSGDFETFLKMMTTQIQNQDPLSPMQADQFASQLATFSMVEQQTLTNQRLEALIGAMATGGLAGYSGLVGRVAAHEKAFQFSGTPVDLEIGGFRDPDGSAKLVILDKNGSVFFERSIPAGQSRITWDGTDPEGRLAQPGQYSAEVRRSSDNVTLDVPVSTAAMIEEVRFGNGLAELLLADGTIISENAVSTLR